MRLFVLGPDLSEPQPVWMNIFWPHYNAMAESIPTTFLGVPTDDRLRRRMTQWFSLRTKHRSLGPDLRQRVIENLDPAGPNVLFVWALNPADVKLAKLLEPVWSEFDHTVLNVVENLQPGHLPSEDFVKFDLITCFCGDLSQEYGREEGLRSLYFPPHTDVLNFHSISAFRPIDLIIVGRRDEAMHVPLHRHFNSPDRERIFIDFVTRTKSRTTVEEEFRLLMSTYARSKAAFCYEPSGIERFKGRSPLTGRWVHAWAAGCTVFGSTPKGRGVESQMDWPEATIDLPSDADEAIGLVERVLNDETELARRRRRNVVEALARHDTRHRLRDLLTHLDISIPDSLQNGLEALQHRANAVKAEC